MKRFALLIPALLLAACTSTTTPEPQQEPQLIQGVISSSSKATDTTKTVTLAEQSFEKISSGGLLGLSEMGVKKIKGHLDSASLLIDLKGSGKWGVVSMYFAPLRPAEFDSKGNEIWREGIDWEKEWKRFRFIGATWTGDCQRHVSSKSFGAVGTASGSRTFDLSALPVTADDQGCDPSQAIVDIVKLINESGGGYIGFLTYPSDYNLKAELKYTGDITVSELTSK